MKIKSFLILNLIFLLSCTEIKNPNLVDEPELARRMADLLFVQHFGEKQMEVERPYDVRLVGDNWEVKGVLPKAPPGYIVAGGTAHVLINKRTGCISDFYHDQ